MELSANTGDMAHWACIYLVNLVDVAARLYIYMVIMMVAGKLLLLTSLIYKIDQINGQIWMACVKICVMWQLLWDRVFTASCPSIPLPNEIMNELIECHVPHSQDPTTERISMTLMWEKRALNLLLVFCYFYFGCCCVNSKEVAKKKQKRPMSIKYKRRKPFERKI